MSLNAQDTGRYCDCYTDTQSPSYLDLATSEVSSLLHAQSIEAALLTCRACNKQHPLMRDSAKTTHLAGISPASERLLTITERALVQITKDQKSVNQLHDFISSYISPEQATKPDGSNKLQLFLRIMLDLIEDPVFHHTDSGGRSYKDSLHLLFDHVFTITCIIRDEMDEALQHHAKKTEAEIIESVLWGRRQDKFISEGPVYTNMLLKRLCLMYLNDQTSFYNLPHDHPDAFFGISGAHKDKIRDALKVIDGLDLGHHQFKESIIPEDMSSLAEALKDESTKNIEQACADIKDLAQSVSAHLTNMQINQDKQFNPSMQSMLSLTSFINTKLQSLDDPITYQLSTHRKHILINAHRALTNFHALFTQHPVILFLSDDALLSVAELAVILGFQNTNPIDISDHHPELPLVCCVGRTRTYPMSWVMTAATEAEQQLAAEPDQQDRTQMAKPYILIIDQHEAKPFKDTQEWAFTQQAHRGSSASTNPVTVISSHELFEMATNMKAVPLMFPSPRHSSEAPGLPKMNAYGFRNAQFLLSALVTFCGLKKDCTHPSKAQLLALTQEENFHTEWIDFLKNHADLLRTKTIEDDTYYPFDLKHSQVDQLAHTLLVEMTKHASKAHQFPVQVAIGPKHIVGRSAAQVYPNCGPFAAPDALYAPYFTTPTLNPMVSFIHLGVAGLFPTLAGGARGEEVYSGARRTPNPSDTSLPTHSNLGRTRSSEKPGDTRFRNTLKAGFYQQFSRFFSGLINENLKIAIEKTKQQRASFRQFGNPSAPQTKPGLSPFHQASNYLGDADPWKPSDALYLMNFLAHFRFSEYMEHADIGSFSGKKLYSYSSTALEKTSVEKITEWFLDSTGLAKIDEQTQVDIQQYVEQREKMRLELLALIDIITFIQASSGDDIAKLEGMKSQFETILTDHPDYLLLQDLFHTLKMLDGGYDQALREAFAIPSPATPDQPGWM